MASSGSRRGPETKYDIAAPGSKPYDASVWLLFGHIAT